MGVGVGVDVGGRVEVGECVVVESDELAVAVEVEEVVVVL